MDIHSIKMKKETKQTEESKTFVLSFTKEELRNPMIKRALCDFVVLRLGLHSTEPFYAVDEAEAEIMEFVPLFTPVRNYNDAKYPNEIGKLKGKPVCTK